MKVWLPRIPHVTGASLLVVSLFSGAASAAAIQRCIGAQGEPMFAEHCANPVPTHRVRPSAASPAVLAAPARSADFCPRTAEALERQVDAALRARNGVRLSGYALWRSVSARAARDEARELLALLTAGSVSVALQPEDGMAVDARESAQVLMVMPVSTRGGVMQSEQLAFRVVRDHGCYWIDPQPRRRHDDEDRVGEPLHDPAFARVP